MSKVIPPNRPVLSLTISPRTERDSQILQKALNDIAQQDSTISVEVKTEGMFIIRGLSESQLNSIRDRVLRDYGVEADIERPRVIYLETIRKQAEAEGEFMRVKVKLRMEPLEEGDGYQFINETRDETVPSEFVGSINSAIREGMKAGILVDQEIVDLRAVLCDGSYPHEEVNESAFRIAALMAFKEGVRRAKPVILEPIMSVRVKGPERNLSTREIVGDLKSRRGDVIGIEHDDNSFLLLRAIVPMAEMNGFSSFLRLTAQGHAEHSMRLIRYAEALPQASSEEDDEAVTIANPDPGPDPGTDQAGVFAFKPRGPKPKSHSAAANLDTPS